MEKRKTYKKVLFRLFLILLMFLFFFTNVYSQRIGKEYRGFITVKGIWKRFDALDVGLVYHPVFNSETKVWMNLAFSRPEKNKEKITLEEIEEYTAKYYNETNREEKSMKKVILNQKYDAYLVEYSEKGKGNKTAYYVIKCHDYRACSVFINAKKSETEKIMKMVEKSWSIEK